MRTPKFRRSQNVAGFSLLEAVIATAMVAMILTALATITAQWLPNWNRGLMHVQRTEQLMLGLERLVADLAAAEYVSANRASSDPLFDGAAHSVTFVRTAVSPNAGPSLELVRLAEIGSESGPLLLRTRLPFVPMIAGINNQPKFTDPVILIRPPMRLSFSFGGENGIWRGSWRNELQLPRAVKLTLRRIATDQILAISTATLLHVQLPPECISAKSLAACWEMRQQTQREAKTSELR